MFFKFCTANFITFRIIITYISIFIFCYIITVITFSNNLRFICFCLCSLSCFFSSSFGISIICGNSFFFCLSALKSSLICSKFTRNFNLFSNIEVSIRIFASNFSGIYFNQIFYINAKFIRNIFDCFTILNNNSKGITIFIISYIITLAVSNFCLFYMPVLIIIIICYICIIFTVTVRIITFRIVFFSVCRLTILSYNLCFSILIISTLNILAVRCCNSFSCFYAIFVIIINCCITVFTIFTRRGDLVLPSSIYSYSSTLPSSFLLT